MNWCRIIRLSALALTSLFVPGYAQDASIVGQIRGRVVDSDGHGSADVTVLAMLDAPAGGTVSAPFRATVLTAPDGSFSIAGVPIGSFRFCTQSTNTALLNTCIWNAFQSHTAVTASALVPEVLIKARSAAQLTVIIEDHEGLLAAVSERHPPDVMVGIWMRADPSIPIQTVYVPLTAVSQSPTGRSYRVFVPYDQQFRLSVVSPSLRLAPIDRVLPEPKALTPMSEVSFTVTVPAGTQPSPYVVAITGKRY